MFVSLLEHEREIINKNEMNILMIICYCNP